MTSYKSYQALFEKSLAVGGLIFQGTTFALPKVFDERLPGLAPTATLVGWYALRYIVTFSVMASTVPLIGWVQGEWGFSKLFGMLAVAALLIFVDVLLLPNSADAQPQRPSSSA